MKTARKILKGLLFIYSSIFTAVIIVGAATFGIQSHNYVLPFLAAPFALYFLFYILKIKRGQKILLFYSLAVTGLMMISGFKSSTTAPEFLSSLFFIPITVFFFFEALPKRTKKKKKEAKKEIPLLDIIPGTEIVSEKEQELKKVEDLYPIEKFGKNFELDRRLFLKLIGSAGISLFLFAIFTRRAQGAFFGSMPGPGTVAIKDSTGAQIDPAIKTPTDGYRINQLDDSSPAYYGFTDKTGAWYIMKEDSSGNYRYVKGASSFSTNWTNRASLTYDYFDAVF